MANHSYKVMLTRTQGGTQQLCGMVSGYTHICLLSKTHNSKS